MIINVNTSSGKQKIEVFEGDDADTLTEEFCEKHGIKEGPKKEKLRGILASELKDHRENLIQK